MLGVVVVGIAAVGAAVEDTSMVSLPHSLTPLVRTQDNFAVSRDKFEVSSSGVGAVSVGTPIVFSPLY